MTGEDARLFLVAAIALLCAFTLAVFVGQSLRAGAEIFALLGLS